MSFDKNGIYALVGLNTSSECMTMLDDGYFYPTVDSVTLVNIRDLEYVDVSLGEFRKLYRHNFCTRVHHMWISSTLRGNESVAIDSINDRVYVYSDKRKKMEHYGKISDLIDCGIYLVNGQYINGLKSDSLVFFGGDTSISSGGILRCFNAYEKVFYNYIASRIEYGIGVDKYYICINTITGKSITIEDSSNYGCNNGEIEIESLWEDDGVFKKIDNLYIIEYYDKHLKDVIPPTDCKALYFYTDNYTNNSLYIDKLVIPPQCKSIGFNGYYRHINFGEVYISSSLSDFEFDSLVKDIKEAVDNCITFRKIKICRY